VLDLTVARCHFTLLRDMVRLFISPYVRRYGVLKRIFLLIAVAVMMAVMLLATAGLA
jgi:hypothetical protein